MPSLRDRVAAVLARQLPGLSHQLLMGLVEVLISELSLRQETRGQQSRLISDWYEV